MTTPYGFMSERSRIRVELPRVLGVLAMMAALSACHASAQPGMTPISAAAAPNQLSAAEIADGWRLLFDGRTLNGWRGLGMSAPPAGHWTVEDGSIKKIATKNVPMVNGQRQPGGDLITDRTYRNFELSWDWKMTPVGNTGLKYNVSEALSLAGGKTAAQLSPSTAQNRAALGFEYQMIDDDRHSDGKLPTHRSGALYDLIMPNERKHLNPVGEWNHSMLIFNGNHGEHWLNGLKVVEYELGSPSLNAALAASKYRVIEGFATRRVTPIVLQDHTEEAYFRNIKIRELP
ncbi:hypothetical protein BH09GEM1_BH09GEM1_46870 [soil metagenome]